MSNFRMAILFLFVVNAFAADFELTCVGSGKLKKQQLNIVVEYTLVSPNAYEEYFAGFLTSALIGTGHTIIERRGLANILKELKMDLSGITKDSTAESKVMDNPFLGKNDLKKIGELLGADVILFFSVWEDKYCNFRLVDCQTSEIFISGEIAKTVDNIYGNKTHRKYANVSTNAICDLINLVASGKTKISGKIATTVSSAKNAKDANKEVEYQRNEYHYIYTFDK